MLRYLPVLLSLIIWSWAGVFVKYLQERADFDAYTQNFYRYTASAVIMLITALIVDRKGLRKAFSSFSFVVTGLFGACYQTSWVLGFYYVYPTFASLIGRSNMIFTVLIGVAQSLYYKSVELVGVAVSQSMTLVAPVLTGLFAWLIFGEYLLAWQWLSAGILLGSLGYLLFLTERKRRIMDAEAAG